MNFFKRIINSESSAVSISSDQVAKEELHHFEAGKSYRNIRGAYFDRFPQEQQDSALRKTSERFSKQLWGCVTGQINDGRTRVFS
ncbi:hypothetical protein LRY65_02655 [Candidatus Woesebacteria bacterium]|nr:hypothetical protein [Candidatus Woesebacteria bacterium]MCD8507068.1 hypothetical protein [Candidatus Woesebacteria bacterium]MCD8527095.1 hypothetical protein [Candidatus Woesebacteria bacterium]MCD8546724.1 hypothetical protein [Candidatus Woesebacteria bacterium]